MTQVWRRLLCSFVVAAFMAAAPIAYGQHINSSPNWVGSGARALGMGGAFIGVADDATAASWNPGGLTQLERPEISAVYSWKLFKEDFRTTLHIRPDGEYDVSLKDFNYISVVYPFRRTIAGRNFVISLNYQQKFDFDRSLDLVAMRHRGPSAGGTIRIPIAFDQKGSLSALSPAVGFELTDRLSCGIVMNIWDSDLISSNGWDTTTRRRLFYHQNGNILTLNDYERYEDFEGINYTFGVLYKPLERLSIGAVYHTILEGEVDYMIREQLDGLMLNRFVGLYKTRLNIDFPSAYGIGIAYRFPNDKLTVSLDVTRREWNEFVKEDPRAGVRRYRVSPVTGMPKSMSPHDPTYTVRLGAEYVFVNPNKPRQNYLPTLRAGLFYDPQPAGGRKSRWWGVEAGDGEVEDYYGVTLGGGVLVKNRVNLDAVYQYRWGRNVRQDTLAWAPGDLERGFTAKVEQHALYVSTIIYF